MHGFWVAPRSWEDWIAHYEQKGFTVLAPAYPGFEVEVEALNTDRTPIEKVTVAQIIERLEGVVRGLDRPPILMGHSAGGVFTPLLMDRGYGAVGVAINSAPTEGVKPDDHLMPPEIQQSTAKHYKAAGTVIEMKEFEGPHLLPPSIQGWEDVADYALDRALRHATTDGSGAV